MSGYLGQLVCLWSGWSIGRQRLRGWKLGGLRIGLAQLGCDRLLDRNRLGDGDGRTLQATQQLLRDREIATRPDRLDVVQKDGLAKARRLS